MLHQYLEISFKKLKSSLYFDKTQLINRDKVVAYEVDQLGGNVIDKKLTKIFEKLTGSEEVWEQYVSEQLNSIEVLTFPKKISNLSSSNENIVYNNPTSDFKVDATQHMFTSNVPLQILSVFWVVTIGVNLDNKMPKNIHGNRLKSSVHENNEPTYSPYLMKEYFLQYEKWRDSGLKLAEQHLEENKNVLIVTMDITRFFYHTYFTASNFDDFFDDYKILQNPSVLDEFLVGVKRVNHLMHQVLEKYSEILQKITHEQTNFKPSICCLPIGFYPSNILSNWYLEKFDKAIIDKWNPLYYGRYVDDIFIVEKVDPISEISSLLEANNCTIQNVLSLLLHDCSKLCPDNKPLLTISQKDSEQYVINPCYLPNENVSVDLTLQTEKTRCYYFKAGQLNPMLGIFIQQLYENKSEFRYLPECDDVILHQDFSKIYQVERAEHSSINQFSQLKDVNINRFNFSKFLGKLSQITKLISDKKEAKVERKLLVLFTRNIIIEYYLYWERILQIFIENGRLDLVEKFSQSVIDALEYLKNIVAEDEEFIDYHQMTTTLARFYLSALHRTTALLWSKEMSLLLDILYKKLFETAGWVLLETNLQEAYCKTRMINKYATPVLVDVLIADNFLFSNEKPVSLTDFEDFTRNITKETEILDSGNVYLFSPYHVSLMDIEYMVYTQKIKGNTADSEIDFHIFPKIEKLYEQYNYNITDKSSTTTNSVSFETSKVIDEYQFEQNSISDRSKVFFTKTSIDGRTLSKVKIALANTSLGIGSFISVLEGKALRSQKRYSIFRKIINEAIQEKVDMLVLPELFLPYEWLPLLARTAAKHQILIITGIEHVATSTKTTFDTKNFLNLTATILPYTSGNHYANAHINLRNKVFFSPAEKKKILGYQHNFVEGNCFDLFCWNNFWFSPYCCFELASVESRTLFNSYIDALVATEWNSDINYYSNIIESSARDMHCYCIQVNMSEYGDSRITQPTKSEKQNLVQVKGGTNSSILIGEIDIQGLRDFQKKDYYLQKEDGRFKPTPPHFDHQKVKEKIAGCLKVPLSEVQDDEKG